jgi:GntR family transcriptional regulator/MocR family aminotransferase
MRALYAERLDALLQAVGRLGLDLEMSAPQAAIHCVGWLPKGIDDRAVAAKAPDYDLELTPISDFCSEPPERAGLLLGFGGYNVREIQAGVRRLGALMQSA